MRNKLVVGNWKMNLTRAQATAAIESLVLLVDPKTEVEVAICPPYLTIECVANLLKSSHFRVGAQDVFWMSAGAFTGSVSASMLADAGCSLCIVGHSETRGRFGKLEVPRALSFTTESWHTSRFGRSVRAKHATMPKPIVFVALFAANYEPSSTRMQPNQLGSCTVEASSQPTRESSLVSPKSMVDSSAVQAWIRTTSARLSEVREVH